MYNLAKSFEALGERQVAIEKYELFVNSPGADPAGRVKAQESLRVLKSTVRTDASGAPTAPASPTPVPVTPPASPQPESPSKLPVIAAFGAGGAGIVFGSIFGVLSLSKKSSLSDACTDHKCPPDSSGDISSLKTTSVLSTVGFVVGAVGLAAGVVFVVTRPSSKRAEQVTAYVGPTGAGIGGRF